MTKDIIKKLLKEFLNSGKASIVLELVPILWKLQIAKYSDRNHFQTKYIIEIYRRNLVIIEHMINKQEFRIFRAYLSLENAVDYLYTWCEDIREE